MSSNATRIYDLQHGGQGAGKTFKHRLAEALAARDYKAIDSLMNPKPAHPLCSNIKPVFTDCSGNIIKTDPFTTGEVRELLKDVKKGRLNYKLLTDILNHKAKNFYDNNH